MDPGKLKTSTIMISLKRVFILLCLLCFVGGKVMATPNDTTTIKLPEADYVVKKIIREKKNLYVIDLERSDSVFRIFSHYDGIRKSGDVELHRHDSVRVELTVPSEDARMSLWDNPFIYTEVQFELLPGVYISEYLHRNTSRFPYYFEIRYCDDLNGPFLRSKMDSNVCSLCGTFGGVEGGKKTLSTYVLLELNEDNTCSLKKSFDLSLIAGYGEWAILDDGEIELTFNNNPVLDDVDKALMGGSLIEGTLRVKIRSKNKLKIGDTVLKRRK